MAQFIYSKLEEKILKFWRDKDIFAKVLAKNKKNKKFVFFEGPPTANGRPGIHHVLARSFKDLVCRYKTMRGFYVERKAGWDTHGLPVELEVEKKLGFQNKQDIEKYGIAKFNKECKKSVWTYKDEWENITKRMGFWLDMKNPYITYDNKYIESLWRVIKEISEKKLLAKDYKVAPYCPRCGTTLSSHELAQPGAYKKIKELSVYVKFKIKSEKLKVEGDNYFLVWTTTPWTLPANVALAVGSDIDYALVRVGSENLILAKSKLKALEPLEFEVVKEFKGKDLEGFEYEPLYNFIKPDKKAYFVIIADFVTVEDGSGIVHIAPAFGEDDMKVGKDNNLPILMTVDANGKFLPEISPWAGIFVKEADSKIILDLELKLSLFKREIYEHEYPFCWRCGTPILYYAKDSWFIKMTNPKIKNAVLKNNKKINWVPDYLKEGRFGEWLKELRDWAFSRERYWGTPLPVWVCGDCGHQKVVGSLNDFDGRRSKKSSPISGNNYFLMRHGTANSNFSSVVSSYPEKIEHHLTKKGEKEVLVSVKKIKREKIDLIFSSDLIRTRETARIAAKELGVAKINFDSRLREINAGVFNGRPIFEYWNYFENNLFLKYEKRPPKGESLKDVKKRMVAFIKSLEKKYSGKNILIVSHGDPIWAVLGALRGFSGEETVLAEKELNPKLGEIKKLTVKNIPLNENGDLDLHRPYVDEVKLKCSKCKGEMNRVKEVVDVWFDSGAMPYAQWHYPFENKNFIDKNQKFPADFIAEGIDQTRGWFYTLLAVSTLLGKEAPYKNAVSLGLVLDAKGQKMSKSKGNVVNPWEIADKYGMDALRWYFFTVNQPAEPKKFDEKDILDKTRGIVSTLWNSFVFYETYADKSASSIKQPILSGNILDKWILSRLQELIKFVSEKMEKYEIIEAAREIESFVVNDFSNWYIRRSRRRLQKPENKSDKEEASKIFEYVLIETVKICAPFIPFISESIYQEIIKYKKGKISASVHLCDFPEFEKKLFDVNVIDKINVAREIVEFSLKLRADAGKKIRQPLSLLKLSGKKADGLGEEIFNIIAEEINVKKVEYAVEIGKEKSKFIESGGLFYFLDVNITPELRMEGVFRDIVRNIQEMRKSLGLTPKNRIILNYSTESKFGDWLETREEEFMKEILAKTAKRLKDGKHLFDIERSVEIITTEEGKKEEFWIGIKKV